RVHDEIEVIEAARPFEGHAALRRDVPRARVVREDERDDASQVHLIEAVVDQRACGLCRVAVTPYPRRELVRDLHVGAFALDGEETDLTEELGRVLQLQRPKAESGRLARGEGHRS